jgi:hypothetical protein
MDNVLHRVKRVPNVAVELPALSPPFISADDAALLAHEAIGNKRDKEYGGAILQHEGGRFYATMPFAGSRSFSDTWPRCLRGLRRLTARLARRSATWMMPCVMPMNMPVHVNDGPLVLF